MLVLTSAWLGGGWAMPAHAGRRHTPPPLVVTAEGAALCPTDAVQAAADAVTGAKGDLEVERALRTYDQTLATWAVCATVLEVPGWSVSPVQDPLAQELLAAAAAPPGSKTRINGAVSLGQAFPEAIALLALQDIATLEALCRVEPAMRLTLTAGRIGPWACPEFVRWHPRADGTSAGVCTDQRSVESMALDALTTLTTYTDPIETCPSAHWLCAPTASRARAIWQAVSLVELPRMDEPPVAVPRWGRGLALEPKVGWSMAVESHQVTFRRREVVRLTPSGLRSAADATVHTVRPPHMEGDPLVYASDDVTVGKLAEALSENNVPRPVFTARDQHTGALVELKLRWAPHQSPSVDTGPVLPVDLDPVGLVADQIARDVDARAGGAQVWLRVHPQVRFADLVAVHGALVERHPDIFVSLRDPHAVDANTD